MGTMDIKTDKFKVIVKPNSRKNEMIGFDAAKNAYLIAIKERPENSKANIELINFLSRELGKKVKIKSGLKSRVKIIETYK